MPAPVPVPELEPALLPGPELGLGYGSVVAVVVEESIQAKAAIAAVAVGEVAPVASAVVVAGVIAVVGVAVAFAAGDSDPGGLISQGGSEGWVWSRLQRSIP